MTYELETVELGHAEGLIESGDPPIADEAGVFKTFPDVAIYAELGDAEDLIESGGPPLVDEYGTEKTYPDVAIYAEE